MTWGHYGRRDLAPLEVLHHEISHFSLSASSAATAPIRYLANPSLAAAALRAGTEQLLADLRTRGFLFKAQVAHDVRDEIDVVVEAGDGSWTGFEVKLSADVADDTAATMESTFCRSPLLDRSPQIAIVTDQG